MRAAAIMLLLAATLLIWVVTVAVPAFTATASIVVQTPTEVDAHRVDAVLFTTFGWSGLVTLCALGCGWAPGRWLGARLSKGIVPASVVLLIAPAIVPPAFLFYAWWQSWPADSGLYRWALQHDAVPTFRTITMVLALIGWSWPIVALLVAGEHMHRSRRRAELLRLDGAGVLTRVTDAIRQDRRALSIAGMLVFVLTVTNTTCFDLALIFSVGNELRAMRELGANHAQVMMAALPGTIMIIVAAVVLLLLARGRHVRIRVPMNDRPSGRPWFTIILWCCTIALPFTLFLTSMASRPSLTGDVRTFFDLYGESLTRSVMVAGIVGVIGAALTLGMMQGFMHHQRVVRVAASIVLAGWALMFIVPAVVVAIGIEGTLNRELVAGWPMIWYQSTIVLVIAYIARFGIIAALLAMWCVRREPTARRDLRVLDGASSLRGFVATNAPASRAAVIAAAVVMSMLALSEIPVTAQVMPPGRSVLTPSLLNEMHYQRPQAVMLATGMLLLLAGGAAVLLRQCWPTARGMALVLLACGIIVLPGCRNDIGDEPEPIRTRLIWGLTGAGEGQFMYPRGIAVDAERDRLFVVDKAARVQRFSLDGDYEAEWQMPDFELGKPTGLNVGPDGRVYVADTHYFRVMVYDPDGREHLRFGSYGEADGKFIYPTDVAFGPNGRIYVAEYGGNDRVQVFERDGTFAFAFGEPGRGMGQLNRPQSMVFNADRTELFIADSCNHRIVVTTPTGEIIRTFGSAGREPGMLSYPYDLTILADGSLLIVEFGNNRVQHMDPKGECLGVFGRVGRGDGELQYPWGIDATDRRVFVLDSGNNRVQVMRTP
ncbi:MAG: SMP-30/gluconolactonase/LRE family protein [Planctomycetota bacterium]